MKKITNIKITNFKSIKELSIDGLKKINVFLGPPNTGKSNILEALSVFSFPYFDFDKSVKFSDLIRYQHPLDLFNDQSQQELVASIQINSKLNLSLKYDTKSNEPKLKIVNPQCFGGEELLYEVNKNNEIKQIGNYFNFYEFVSSVEENYEFPILKYTFKDKKDNIASVWNARLVPFFGENLGIVVSQNKDLQEFITSEFKKINLELVIDKQTRNISAQRRISENLVSSMPFFMLADTFQRILFYKAAIASNENSALLFEEPEAFCYEPYILDFTNAVKYDKNNNQFLIVTHNDYIVQEFLRDEESKQNINIYLVNAVNGITEVKLLQPEKNEAVYELGMNPFFNFDTLWENN